MVRIVDKDGVEQLLNMELTIDAVEEAFRLQRDALVPNRIQIKQDDPNGEAFVMPGVIERSGTLGLKTVTVYPENDEHGIPRSLGTILLHNNETGALESILDGTHITNYRTGAIGAVAARYLAPNDPSVAGVIGSSTQGRHQVLALDAELDLETIRIYSRSELKYEAVEMLSDRVSADLVAVDSAEDACRDAAIVVAATAATDPVVPPSAVRSDALVVGIGANDPDMRELPGEIVERANQIYVDDYDLCVEVGDIADAIAEGRLTEDDIVPFEEHLAGGPPYRSSDETTVLKSVGSIVFDIHVGRQVLDRAAQQDIGVQVDLQGMGKADPR